MNQLAETAREQITVKRVFGDAYERDGVTVIPAAQVAGGGGGGGDNSAEGGSGGGFGVRAKPVGAYVIRAGEVSWHPALDLNRVILGAQVAGIVIALVVRSIVKAGNKRR